jgi:hypothetical protein
LNPQWGVDYSHSPSPSAPIVVTASATTAAATPTADPAVQLRGDLHRANGRVLPEHGATTEIIDLAAGTDTAVGGIIVRLPLGHGVIHDAGRVVSDADENVIFEAGSHPGLDGDTTAYCDALAS